MPELPEVETYRRRLEGILVGRAIRAAVIADGRLSRPRRPDELASALQGERVTAVPIADAIAQPRRIALDSDLVRTAQSLGICLGR